MRSAAVPLLALLCLGTAAGCGDGTENAEAECARTFYGAAKSPCTVTFHRGTASSASVLGRKIDLLSAGGNSVTLRIADADLTVSRDDREVQEANLNVTIKSITGEAVIVGFSEVAV